MNPHDYAQILYEVLEDKNEDRQSQILSRFKKLLIKNKDAHLSSAVEKELAKIQLQKGREKITYITSAAELTTSQKKEFENISSAPREFSVNPNLLGGVAVRQKDILYNTTLRKKIESLKNSL